ncbi:LRR receptor-like serine threonine-protein kinase [Seminavis robusta]|uniref:LRR receptor-like serine threonine-protein kinase n=1 Tax=Seminavis robusta TaxID=568900 RepID=A0A9N8DRH8_9STRA|nr:LRR receptor-like serine threonine-protein kinase [Seminavis robusta]|eukprot:Sro230_g093280.1 LRR receptor-like serine threonine-protein kinase (1942) ;mRNA; r:27080-33533
MARKRAAKKKIGFKRKFGRREEAKEEIETNDEIPYDWADHRNHSDQNTSTTNQALNTSYDAGISSSAMSPPSSTYPASPQATISHDDQSIFSPPAADMASYDQPTQPRPINTPYSSNSEQESPIIEGAAKIRAGILIDDDDDEYPYASESSSTGTGGSSLNSSLNSSPYRASARQPKHARRKRSSALAAQVRDLNNLLTSPLVDHLGDLARSGEANASGNSTMMDDDMSQEWDQLAKSESMLRHELESFENAGAPLVVDSSNDSGAVMMFPNNTNSDNPQGDSFAASSVPPAMARQRLDPTASPLNPYALFPQQKSMNNNESSLKTSAEVSSLSLNSLNSPLRFVNRYQESDAEAEQILQAALSGFDEISAVHSLDDTMLSAASSSGVASSSPTKNIQAALQIAARKHNNDSSRASSSTGSSNTSTGMPRESRLETALQIAASKCNNNNDQNTDAATNAATHASKDNLDRLRAYSILSSPNSYNEEVSPEDEEHMLALNQQGSGSSGSSATTPMSNRRLNNGGAAGDVREGNYNTTNPNNRSGNNMSTGEQQGEGETRTYHGGAVNEKSFSPGELDDEHGALIRRWSSLDSSGDFVDPEISRLVHAVDEQLEQTSSLTSQTATTVQTGNGFSQATRSASKNSHQSPALSEGILQVKSGDEEETAKQRQYHFKSAGEGGGFVVGTIGSSEFEDESDADDNLRREMDLLETSERMCCQALDESMEEYSPSKSQKVHTSPRRSNQREPPPTLLASSGTPRTPGESNGEGDSHNGIDVQSSAILLSATSTTTLTPKSPPHLTTDILYENTSALPNIAQPVAMLPRPSAFRSSIFSALLKPFRKEHPDSTTPVTMAMTNSTNDDHDLAYYHSRDPEPQMIESATSPGEAASPTSSSSVESAPSGALAVNMKRSTDTISTITNVPSSITSKSGKQNLSGATPKSRAANDDQRVMSSKKSVTQDESPHTRGTSSSRLHLEEGQATNRSTKKPEDSDQSVATSTTTPIRKGKGMIDISPTATASTTAALSRLVRTPSYGSAEGKQSSSLAPYQFVEDTCSFDSVPLVPLAPEETRRSVHFSPEAKFQKIKYERLRDDNDDVPSQGDVADGTDLFPISQKQLEGRRQKPSKSQSERLHEKNKPSDNQTRKKTSSNGSKSEKPKDTQLRKKANSKGEQPKQKQPVTPTRRKSSSNDSMGKGKEKPKDKQELSFSPSRRMKKQKDSTSDKSPASVGGGATYSLLSVDSESQDGVKRPSLSFSPSRRIKKKRSSNEKSSSSVKSADARMMTSRASRNRESLLALNSDLPDGGDFSPLVPDEDGKPRNAKAKAGSKKQSKTDVLSVSPSPSNDGSESSESPNIVDVEDPHSSKGLLDGEDKSPPKDKDTALRRRCLCFTISILWIALLGLFVGLSLAWIRSRGGSSDKLTEIYPEPGTEAFGDTGEGPLAPPPPASPPPLQPPAPLPGLFSPPSPTGSSEPGSQIFMTAAPSPSSPTTSPQPTANSSSLPPIVYPDGDELTMTNETLDLINLLITSSVDRGAALLDRSTPEFASLVWLSDNVFLDTYSDKQKVQRFVLGTVYYSMGGKDWTENEYWMTDIDECRWYSRRRRFPACNKDGDYINLELAYLDVSGTIPKALGMLSNSLERLDIEGGPTTFVSGTIPSELGYLSLMREFRMRDNRLSGELPSELRRWTFLETLDLKGNNLRGTLPFDHPFWPSLTDVDLGENFLVGSIPTGIGRQDMLTKLFLQDNLLDGPVPSEIGKLYNLKDMYLDQNNLKTLPSEIGLLHQLQDLRMAANSLNNAIPTEIGLLTRLRTVSLTFNALTGSIPTEIGLLKGLRDRIDLSFNKLSGTVPSEIGELTRMKHLLLHSNQLSGELPSEIGELDRLNTLRIDQNNMMGAVSDDICAVFNTTLPYFYADCKEIDCPCCIFCCVDTDGCSCRFESTFDQYLCY